MKICFQNGHTGENLMTKIGVRIPRAFVAEIATEGGLLPAPKTGQYELMFNSCCECSSDFIRV